MTMLRTKPEPDHATDRAMRRARRRFARRQWARRYLTWRIVVAVVVVVGLLAGGWWLVFVSPVLAVQGVTVRGVHVLPAAAVRRAAAVPVGEPLATVDLGAVRQRVQALKPVRSVDASRSWPHRVLVVVAERVPVAVVERAGFLRGLDAHGVLFRRYASRPKRLPLVEAPAAANGPTLAGAASVVAALPAALSRRVDHVRVESLDSITLVLRNGHHVLWGSAAGSAQKAEVLTALLKMRHPARYYDVSVPAHPLLRR